VFSILQKKKETEREKIKRENRRKKRRKRKKRKRSQPSSQGYSLEWNPSNYEEKNFCLNSDRSMQEGTTLREEPTLKIKPNKRRRHA